MSGPDGDAKTVLAKDLGGGPFGLGDPEDRSLRRVEREIMIPQKMKAKAKKHHCSEQVKAFGECAKEKGFSMPFKCRGLAKELETCLSDMYKDPHFIKLCTEEYLSERSEFRRTGIKTKEIKKEASM